MSWNDKDKQRAYIGELQGLQRQINFLKKSSGETKEPSIENAIDILRNSQDKLYSALAQHGVTAEEVHKVIIENSDQAIVKEIMRLQGTKNTINSQLAQPNLTPEKRQSLETRLTRTTQQHTAKWDEIINSPRQRPHNQQNRTSSNQATPKRTGSRPHTRPRPLTLKNIFSKH